MNKQTECCIKTRASHNHHETKIILLLMQLLQEVNIWFDGQKAEAASRC